MEGNDQPIPDMKNAATTRFGKPWWMCTQLTTKNLLKQRVHARKDMVCLLERISLEEGAVMVEVESRGFMGIDGVQSLITGITLIPHVHTTRNNHPRLSSVGVASGEKNHEVTVGLNSTQDASDRLFGMGEGDAEWIMSDDAKGFKSGIKAHTEAEDYDKGADCSIHFHENSLPGHKAIVNNKENWSTITGDVYGLELFGHVYGSQPWSGVKSKWLSLEEKEFTTWFQEARIDNGFCSRQGFFAYGIDNHNNSLEANNSSMFVTHFRTALRLRGEKTRLPVAVGLGIEVLIDDILPRVSREIADKEFETDPEPLPKDYRQVPPRTQTHY
jgi:hypothetical protein